MVFFKLLLLMGSLILLTNARGKFDDDDDDDDGDDRESTIDFIVFTKDVATATDNPIDDKLFSVVADVTTDSSHRNNSIPINSSQTFHYTISSDFDKSEKLIIKEAISEMERSSKCIRFVEGKGSNCNIKIVAADRYNSSAIGCLNNTVQLSLQRSKCVDKGHILHKLMHIMGFGNENNRPDRDEYIVIDRKNILQNAEQYFKKDKRYIPSFTEDFPYDYHSVTHLTYNSFAKNQKKPTIFVQGSKTISKDLGEAFIEGKLSNMDIVKLQVQYGCAKHLKFT